MITVSHAAVEISRLWCERDPNGWMRAVNATHALGLKLIDVIADRFRWYRDELARYAFDHRLPVWQAARELRVDRAAGRPVLIQVRGTRGRTPTNRPQDKPTCDRNRPPIKPINTYVPETIAHRIEMDGPGGKWQSQ